MLHGITIQDLPTYFPYSHSSVYRKCYYLHNAHWKLNGKFLHLLIWFCLYCYLLLSFLQIFLFVHPNIILPLFLSSSPLRFRQILFKTCCSSKTTVKNIRHDMYFSTQCLCLSSAYVRKWHNMTLTFLCQGWCWAAASPLPLLAKKNSVHFNQPCQSRGSHSYFIYRHRGDGYHFEIFAHRQAQPTYTCLWLSSVPDWNTLNQAMNTSFYILRNSLLTIIIVSFDAIQSELLTGQLHTP
jgi:hypothetical protein